MPKHQVIRDAGQSLLGVLRSELQAQRSRAKAYLAVPTAEFLRKNQPCLALHLYDVRPFINVRVDEKWNLEEEVTDDTGETYVVRYGRPLELALHYLLTASADDLADEHEILALGMKAFLDNSKLTGEQISGDSFFKGDSLPIHPHDGFTLETAAHVFGAFGSAPRLSVGYVAQVRLASGKELGRSKRVRQRHIDVFDQLRPPPGSVSAKELGVEAKSPKIVAAPGKK
jgi:hypothetical protein